MTLRVVAVRTSNFVDVYTAHIIGGAAPNATEVVCDHDIRVCVILLQCNGTAHGRIIAKSGDIGHYVLESVIATNFREARSMPLLIVIF